MVTDNEYDRLVFKNLEYINQKESLIFAAKTMNLFYELLAHLKVTENIFNEDTTKSLKSFNATCYFSSFLYKVSDAHPLYIRLKLNLLKSIVLTGGITKVLVF